jgi:putative DNA primase/helicase
LTIGSLLHWASEDSETPIEAIIGDKPKSETGSNRKRGLTMTMGDLSAIEVEAVRWLWKGRIPEAKLTIVGGDMGDGKSFVTLDIAARVSAGRDWPDGSRCPQGRVLIINTEDNLSDTVKPRLIEAGADETQIKVYRCMTDRETGAVERLNLYRDLPAIEEVLTEFPDIKLVLIDPVLSFATDHNVNEYHSIYKILGPLNEIATRHDVSIVGNCHTNKADTLSAKHRITGSTAILAAARCAWIVLRDPDNEDRRRRLFLPLKQNNSSGDDTGLAFRLSAADPDGVAHVEWCDGIVEETADEVLRRAATVRGEMGRGKDADNLAAVRYLKEILRDGPVESTRIEAEAKPGGTSYGSCLRHKKKLKIVVRKSGGLGTEGEWKWYLPEHLGEAPEADEF